MNMEILKLVFDIIGSCFVVYLIGYSTFLFVSVVIGATTLYKKKMQDRLMNKFTELSHRILFVFHKWSACKTYIASIRKYSSHLCRK